jgi:methylated-DNA-[protein]-cysteine S-methyltransferase
MTVAASPLACAALDVAAAHARLWALWSSTGLRRLVWSAANSDPERVLGPGPPPQQVLPEPYAGVLAAYFAGEQVEPASLPVDLQGTPFQLRVWHALRQVPRGAVRSYQGIASDIGSPRAMRAVGAANGKNPVAIVVPCHRVVEAGMRLGGYSAGLPLKRFLLSLEGADVRGDQVQPGQLGLTGLDASDE